MRSCSNRSSISSSCAARSKPTSELIDARSKTSMFPAAVSKRWMAIKTSLLLTYAPCQRTLEWITSSLFLLSVGRTYIFKVLTIGDAAQGPQGAKERLPVRR